MNEIYHLSVLKPYQLISHSRTKAVGRVGSRIETELGIRFPIPTGTTALAHLTVKPGLDPTRIHYCYLQLVKRMREDIEESLQQKLDKKKSLARGLEMNYVKQETKTIEIRHLYLDSKAMYLHPPI